MNLFDLLPVQATPDDYGVPSEGEKVTGRDAGTFGDVSFTNDYGYVCVVGGDAETAVWKHFVLFKS